jgi:hypothetical protein
MAVVQKIIHRKLDFGFLIGRFFLVVNLSLANDNLERARFYVVGCTHIRGTWQKNLGRSAGKAP